MKNIEESITDYEVLTMTKTPTLLSILALELVLIELYIPALIVVAIATLLDNFREDEENEI